MVTPSVIQKPEGNKPEVEAEKSATTNGKSPVVEKVSSEKTYTKAEYEAAIHALQSESGRARTAIEKERDGLKTQLASVQSDIKDNDAEVEKLQSKLDSMASDDPGKFDLAKELKVAREERRQLRTDRATLETEKQSHAESVKLATDTLREIAIWDIAAEFDGGDPEKLKELCDVFESSSEEQVRKVAETLWVKKGAVPANSGKPPLKLDSGGSGGAITDQKIMEDYGKNPYDPTVRDRYLELRRKKEIANR